MLNIEDVWQHTQGPTSLVELAMEQKATNVALVQHHHYLCLILHSMLVLSLKSVKPMSLFDTKVRGFAKKKIPKIRINYGSGWVGPGLTRNIFLENRPKIALNQY